MKWPCMVGPQARALETRKAGVRAACHLPDPISRDSIESLWVLYSDGWWSEKTVGLYPTRPSYMSFQASFFIIEKVRWGVWNSGKIRLKKALQHSPPWAVSCAPGGPLSLPGTQWLRYHLDCSWSLVEHKGQSLWSPGVRVGRTCSSIL